MTSIVIKSTDSGAPTLTGQTGSLVTVLDKCLVVNHVFGTSDDVGFTDQSVEARSEGGTPFNLLLTNVTAARLYIGMPTTFSRAKFDLATVGVGGTYIWEYWNGSAWTTLTVTDGTSGFTADGTVTWTIPSLWATTAVNAVTQYWVRIRASVTPGTNPTVNFVTVGGWTRSHTAATNQAAWRQGTGSNGFIFRLVGDGTTQDRAVGYETLTTLGSTLAGDTATGRFPTDAQFSGGLYWTKSSTADATARPWVVAVSEKLFHLYTDHLSTNITATHCIFGDIKTFKTGDAYHTIHIAGATGTPGSTNRAADLVAVGAAVLTAHFMSRNYTQLGTSIIISKHSDAAKLGGISTPMGAGGLVFPNPIDGGLYLAQVYVHETSASIVRGELPGFWAPLHSRPLTHLDTFTGTGTLAGRTFMALNMYNSAQAFLETSDTWNV